MKTMKNYIWMAAIALTAATLTACSSDDLATKESPVQKNNVVTLTATLNTDGDGATRSTMKMAAATEQSSSWKNLRTTSSLRKMILTIRQSSSRYCLR